MPRCASPIRVGMEFRKDRLDGGIGLDHCIMHRLMEGFLCGMSGLRGRGILFCLLRGKDGWIILYPFMKRLELLAFALRKVRHSCRFMMTRLLPRADTGTCIGCRRRGSILSNLGCWSAIVFAWPFWRHHFGKDRLNGRVDGNHRIVHRFFCILHGLMGRLHLLIQRRILLDRLVMSCFHLSSLRLAKISHRTTLTM